MTPDAAGILIEGLEALPDNFQREGHKAALAKVQELRPLLTEYFEQNPESLGLISDLYKQKLGIGIVDLRRSLAPAEGVGGDKPRQGQEMVFSDLEPWPEPVNGAELLDDIAGALGRLMVLPAHAATAVSLWVVFTYAFDCFEIAPRLFLTSPSKRCGTSRLLTFVSYMVKRPLLLSNITGPVVFRTIAKWYPTLLIDEADTLGDEKSQLDGILNSGHTRDAAMVPRCDGADFDVKLFSTWAPMAFSAIGKLKGTAMDRTILISLKRKARGETIRRGQREHRSEFQILGCRAARWVEDNLESLRAAKPEAPESLDDRACDNWGPLFSIADLVGGGWSERALSAALALSGVEARADDASYGELLLADLAALFKDRAVDRLSSVAICEALAGLEARPWPEYARNDKPITPSQLAFLLGKFGIRPRTVRIDDGTQKGYTLAGLKDSFARYVSPDPPDLLPSIGVSPSHDVTPSQTPPPLAETEFPCRNIDPFVTAGKEGKDLSI